MLVKSDLKRLLSDLAKNRSTQVSFAGSTIMIHVSEENDRLELTTPVYWGGNYLPHSVRNCLTQRAPFDEKIIQTTLTLDEEKFEITLKYKGLISEVNEVEFNLLMEEFSFLANGWREWLDQHDKNDLVYVRVSK